MCSISGVTWSDRDIIEIMNKKQHNRGPDDSGILVEQNYSLGHTLLSINSDHGKQPIRGRGDLVFNGQIYDCPWQDELDSRWLLRHLDKHGCQFLENVNGMWAFAYVRDNILYLVRDHFGAKPIYYSIVDKGLIFASTIPALVETGIVNTEFCDDSIYTLENGNYWQSGELTPYKYIKKVALGGVYAWDLNKQEFISKNNLWQNFSLSDTQEFDHFEFRNKVVNAITTVSNTQRDLSVLLSGGLDSTLVTGVLALKKKDFRNFTLKYESTGNIEGERTGFLDEEVDFAQRTCKYYKLEHCVATLPENKDYIETKASECLDVVGNIFEDSYRMIPRYTLLGVVAKNNGKVVLTGDGGDEIFTGYNLHRYWVKEGLKASELDHFLKITKVDEWFPMQVVENCDNTRARLFLGLITQCETYLLRLDAFGGEHSLEVRTPLLYQDLVKYTCRLPTEVRLKFEDPKYAGINKYLIREVFADVIPDSIRYRSLKIGWSLPWWRESKHQKARKRKDRELLKRKI